MTRGIASPTYRSETGSSKDTGTEVLEHLLLNVGVSRYKLGSTDFGTTLRIEHFKGF